MLRAALALLLLVPVAHPVFAEQADLPRIVAAAYESPTRIYPHGVLGDDLEWADLVVTVSGTDDPSDQRVFRIGAPENSVFEDIAPRLWDVTGDGLPEVVAVQSDQAAGARLLIYGLSGGVPGVIADTGPIGTRFRWLAPVGAADFDGDGWIEIAYVDRPHLARTLRIWRFGPEGFVEIASIGGVSNHRIGEDFISGGVRHCNAVPQMVLADAGWTRVVVAGLAQGEITLQDARSFAGASSFTEVLNCR